MIKVIGTKNCGKCEEVKKALDAKGIEYEYIPIEELSMQSLAAVSQMGCRSLPILLKDEVKCTLEEVLK